MVALARLLEPKQGQPDWGKMLAQPLGIVVIATD
jgi:hypothetical protein